MPHRDFDELYTGGLTYLNAAAFRVSGANFATLRWMLFLFFLAWVPALFYIASRLVPPLAAGLITCLAVAASVPVYSAPVPSWYNLFFATFGTAAALRFLENRNRWWLAIAGLCAGLSFLAKISGLYFLAAIFLFLIFLEQTESQSSPHLSPRRLQLIPSSSPLACWHLCSCSSRQSPALIPPMSPTSFFRAYRLLSTCSGANSITRSGPSAQPIPTTWLDSSCPFLQDSLSPSSLF